jgi:hypothetical protein
LVFDEAVEVVVGEHPTRPLTAAARQHVRQRAGGDVSAQRFRRHAQLLRGLARRAQTARRRIYNGIVGFFCWLALAWSCPIWDIG